MVDKQVHGRHGRAGSKLLFLSNILMCFHIVILVLKCSWTHDGLSRHKSGDRYPLRPPSFVSVDVEKSGVGIH